MNRRTLLTTLLSGLSAGVAAMARKSSAPQLKEIIDPKGVDLSVVNSRPPRLLGHTRDLSVNVIPPNGWTIVGVNDDPLEITHHYELINGRLERVNIIHVDA